MLGRKSAEGGSPPLLVKYDAACRALAVATRVDEVKRIRDIAVAMKAYARQAGNHEMEANAVELRMRATRSMDLMRQKQAATIGLAKGTRGSKVKGARVDQKPTLADAGINKYLAHEGRKLGAMPEHRFELAVAAARENASRVVNSVLHLGEAEARRATRRQAFETTELTDDAYEYRIGRAQDMFSDIAPGSVALILTDPPYHDEAGPAIEWLAEFAADALMPGGSLIMFTGHHRLPNDFAAFAGKLRYWWLLSLRHNESKRLPGKFVVACHKPVLWFVQTYRRNNEYVVDVLNSAGRDKDLHEWGQGDGGIAPLIDALTEPGELIIDPFAGSRLWGQIAIARKRRWLGCDIVQGGTCIP
jgi:hypothetical protein